MISNILWQWREHTTMYAAIIILICLGVIIIINLTRYFKELTRRLDKIEWQNHLEDPENKSNKFYKPGGER